MKEWEHRYKHELAGRDSQMMSQGIEPIKERYGEITLVKRLWMKFNGKEFFKIFNGMGHDRMEYAQCKCQKTKEVE